MVEAFLDSAIIIDILRSYAPATAWFTTSRGRRFGINPIIWMEIIAGASDKSSQIKAEKFLTQFEMNYLTQADMDWGMAQLIRLKLSHGVGFADCLVASSSARLQTPIYTRNLKHLAPLLNTLAIQPY